jgi:EAL domain-containing protein (putative c-di-GMP-specific phosphodiesterase class I)/GGDEF domain-containing protein
MYEINFEMPAFLLSALCLVYSLTAKHKQYVLPKGFKAKLTSQHFAFLLMLLTNMLSSISSVIGVYLTFATFESVAFWQYLFHAFYFFFHTTLSVSFTLYIMNVTGTTIKWKKYVYVLFFAPYIISELIVLTNRFTSLAFYMDENLIYHRGALMPLLYGIGGLYVVLGFVFFMRNKKAISRSDSFAVGTFIIIAAVGIVIQAVKSSFLVELFAEALACLVIMIVLEEKSGRIEPVTGLLNRLAFSDMNKKLMGTKQKYLITFIKLSELERITKRFNGHETDAFLIGVGNFLSDIAGFNDVYCYNKEDFAVIFKDEQYSACESFNQKVLERFENDWEVGSLRVRADAVTITVRVPEDIKTWEEVVNLVSLGYTKLKPGSYSVPFEEIVGMMKSSSYEAALRKAINENKLMVKYQPIWSTKEKRTVSAEALLRVDCDELKNLSPEVYIPVAEKTGLIREIGLFVLEDVCRFLNEERIKGSAIQYVELNLSVYQFMFDDLVDSFEEIRKKYNIESKQINLEVTETAMTFEGSKVSETLEKFKKLGYTLSLDDFGTGYSNLIRMITSDYRNIKIDKSILWNVAKDSNDHELLESLVGFIKSMGSDIIQEGVETKEQLDLVTKCGCDYIQGFYFSKPILKEDFFEYIEKEVA